MLHIRLLGDFCLHDDDRLVTQVNTARLQALLAFLVLHRHAPQSRLHVASLFWPDSTEAQARTNLRHQLHLLRQALPQADCFLQADAHTLQWRPDASFRLDVDDFESAASRDASLIALQEAIDAYRGDLLPSCYDEWIVPERERLRQTYVEALGQFIARLEQNQDYAAAICYAQRLQRHDPLHEATYCRLMRLYALNGDPAGVQRTYQDCVTVLQQELGAQPSPAARQAYERLLHVDVPQAKRHNLPAQLTSIVGRDEELAQLAQRLADPTCRLLTVVGTGGIGKTRLAIEAARDQVAAFSHGVMLVSLTGTSAPEFLVPAIADALGFTFHGSQDPKVQLLNYLREKHMLLILDNFEHLLAGAGLLVEILNSTPAVKLMVTSRERLKLPGEWAVEIHRLAVPGANDAERLEEYAAAQLFLQCARRVRLDFSLSSEDRPAVARLCQLVEGLPLGLELAATWVHVLSCEEIVRELVKGLDLLITISPHVPERHRSIRAVFDHSRNLLSAEEQHVFRRLSVFQGGFRREAAQQVAGASLPLLAALVDKSLLRWDRAGRYEMHELVRQYAAEQLAAVPAEKEATQDRHGRFYLELLRQQEPRLKSREQQQAMTDIKGEIDNVRMACQHAITQMWADELGQAAQTLIQFYDIQGWLHEAEAIFRQAVDLWTNEQRRLAADNRERAIGLGQMLALQGWFSLRLGLIRKAKELFQQSVALLRHFDARAELGDILPFFSMVAWACGDYREAQIILQEALTIHRAQAASWSIALCLGVMGNVAASLGNYQEAKQLLQQALSLFKAVGDPRSTALALSYLGRVSYMLGDLSEAKGCLQESLTLSRAMDDRWSMAICCNELGATAFRSGAANWLQAKRFHEESLTIAKELGDRPEITVSLIHLGHVSYALADFEAAHHHFLTALRTAHEGQQTPRILDALVGMATMLCRPPVEEIESDLVHKKERAVELLALVLNHSASDFETKGRAQQLLAELEAELPPQVMAAAHERGRARSLEEVAAEIMTERRGV